MTTIKPETTVKYLTTIRLSEKGQMVLPKEYRTEQNLEAGSPITLLAIGNSLLLLPEMNKFNRLCKRIEKTLNDSSITERQLMETLSDTRREIFAELYPNLTDDSEGNL